MIKQLTLILLLIIAGCRTQETKEQSSLQTVSPQESAPVETHDMMSYEGMRRESTIDMTDSGFNPKTLTVAVGTKVTFLNKNSEAIWPASDNHPTHTLYPGSGITKCKTGETIFDACKSIPSGGSWSFTFTEKGSWSYHDHRNPGMTGIVIVN